MRIFFLALLCVIPFFASAAGVGIAAVVNEAVITTQDVNSRIALIMTTNNQLPENATPERIRPQVLQQMIDEELQAQEAEKLGLRVSEADIDAATRALEKQRGLTPGSLEAQARAQGIDPKQLRAQLSAQLLWNQLVLRAVRPQVKISDAEIERARQLSPANASSVFGEQAASDSASIIAKLFRIIVAGADAQTLTEQSLQAIKATPGPCEANDVPATLPEGASVQASVLEQPMANLSEQLRAIINPLPAGGYSAAFTMDGLPHVVWLCERMETPPPQATKEIARERVFAEKIELEARKYMRNLRRNAYVDVVE